MTQRIGGDIEGKVLAYCSSILSCQVSELHCAQFPHPSGRRGGMQQYDAGDLLLRARTKIKREVLRVPVIRPWSNSRYYARLGRYAENLPWLSSDRFDIFAELRDEGIAVRDATTMIPTAALEVADRFADRLRESVQTSLEIARLRMPEITLPIDMPDMPADCAPLYEWGLAEENLDLAERYIGLPVFFLGAAVRRERVDGPVSYNTRRWHKDIDDRRMLKMIIYLNDVGAGGGGFEYLNRRSSDDVACAFRYSAGHLSDTEVDRVVPRSAGVPVTGPRLTSVFVDATRLMHRVQPPTENDRYSLTLTYVSTTPLYETFPECRLSPIAIAGLSNELTARQRQAATVRARLG
jgi:hypothetical protein